MASDGVMTSDYAETHSEVNAFPHSTRRTASGMHIRMTLLAKNLRHLIPKGEEAAWAGAAKIDQTWLNRVMNPNRIPDGIKQPRDSTLRPLADALGYSIYDLKEVDLAESDAGPRDREAGKLDAETMRSALISFLRAVEDEHQDIHAIPDLAEVIIYAYAFRETQPKKMTKAQYRVFDESIRMKLKGALHALGRVS